MANTRIINKKNALDNDLDLFMEWINDLRCYLVEADHENIDRNIIIRQFKRKFKKAKFKYAVITRFAYYIKVATDRA